MIRLIAVRRAFIPVFTLFVIAFLGLPAVPAHAVPALPTLTAPATKTTGYQQSVALTTLTLDDGDQPSVQLQITATHGTLTMTTLTGLTFSTGDGTADAELQFTGTPTNVQNALNTLSFIPANGYVGAAVVTYKTTLGSGLFNPANSHFYEYVAGTLTWTAAEAAAAARTLSDMDGYLVTVTSSSEQAFVQSKLQGQGWMGSSDAGFEDDWEWVTGPEANTLFWVGDGDGTPEPGEYNNWSTGEPNNAGNEDYGHFLVNGKWNDYAVNNVSIQGYIVEYGGMPGDPDPVDVQTTNVTVNAIAPSAPGSLVATPGNEKLTLSWSAPSNGGAAIDHYLVEYKLHSDSTWTALPTTTSTNKSVPDLTNGSLHDVRVSAHNSVGYGAVATSSGTPKHSPLAPTDLTLIPTTQQITVEWGGPDANGAALTATHLEYRLSGTSSWTSISTSATSPTVIGDLEKGTEYDVRVYGTNSVGNGVVSSKSTSTLNTLPSPGTSAPVAIIGGNLQEVPVAPNVPEPVSVAATPTGAGSWTVATDGGVFAEGDAQFFGSQGGQPLNAPMVGIAPSPTANGYYLVAEDGGVFAYGDAGFQGSMGGQPLNAPMKAIAPSCSNNGYYLVAEDGGVFAFGDARFLGSMAGLHLNNGMLGIVPSCTGNGYWLFAADGGVFTYGDAQFYGSLGDNPPIGGVIGMVAADDGKGYWLIGGDGHAYGFGSVG